MRKTFRKAYFKALAQYFEVSHGMARTDARALANAVRENVAGKPALQNGDEYGAAVEEWLPRHQQENGFEPIPAGEARRAHEYAMRTAERCV